MKYFRPRKVKPTDHPSGKGSSGSDSDSSILRLRITYKFLKKYFKISLLFFLKTDISLESFLLMGGIWLINLCLLTCGLSSEEDNEEKLDIEGLMS